jgi:hypothetical protein
LFSSPKIARIVKSKKMRWVGHVEHMGKKTTSCCVLMEKPEGTDHSEDVGVDRRTISNVY